MQKYFQQIVSKLREDEKLWFVKAKEFMFPLECGAKKSMLLEGEGQGNARPHTELHPPPWRHVPSYPLSLSDPNLLQNIEQLLAKQKSYNKEPVLAFIVPLRDSEAKESSSAVAYIEAKNDTRQLQLLHFCLFLAISLAALLANGLIISAVACGHHLHTPMFFFLLNLALSDLGCICTTFLNILHKEVSLFVPFLILFFSTFTVTQ
ncbi:hypothetical protein IHE44_0006022 [Lamprotornis superbus]|uniref:G-protein coupled receptors family 1 profile domain-containing protein n=1 Tax=Lamprotornis superbus TaxID=245042 RepID=A0A835NEW0_9PASS|nr:hypothetical protein IHE44_0006022 [Lamprotornis superbus]